MKYWRALGEGSKIEIVSPGFRSDPKFIRKSLGVLRKNGFISEFPAHLFGPDVLCANSDHKRFALLQKSLSNPQVDAVWCVRGGYGSLRLLPSLEEMIRPKVCKPLIGLSDITVLQSFLLERWGWPSLHAPTLDRLSRGPIKPAHLAELFNILNGKTKCLSISGLIPMNKSARKRGRVRGVIKGGNLITLQGLLGTNAEMNPKGSILFFEDIGERGYRVDRVLTQFQMLGVFRQAKAVIFGQFTGGEEPNGRDLVPPVLQRFANEVSIPVFKNFPLGHGEIQRPLALGVNGVLKTGDRGELNYPTGVE